MHAALMVLAFPPIGLWWVVIMAPLPLVWVAARTPPHGEPGRWAWARRWNWPLLTGLGVAPLWLYEVQWVIPVTGFGYVPMVAALAGFASLFVWALSRVPAWMPWSLAVPVLWVGVEFFRGEVVLTGFPWLLAAHPLIDVPLLTMPAAVGGVYLVGVLVTALAGAAADLGPGPRRHRTAAVAAVSLAGATWAGSWAVWGAHETARGIMRVAVVQTNVPQSNKSFWSLAQQIDDWNRFEELTVDAAQAQPRPDVIVWPETMFPGPFLDPESVAVMRTARAYWQERLRPDEPPVDVPFTAFVDRLLAVQESLETPMVVGGVAARGLRIEDCAEGLVVDWAARFNSVFLVSRGEVSPIRYDKMALTPFGEVMPYVEAWPWLEERLVELIGPPGMRFDLEPGTRPAHLTVDRGDRPAVQVVTPICFEVTKAFVCRRLVRGMDAAAPKLIVNVTNDGWFGWFDAARHQNLQIARWRCVELGVPMVRAANTGISAVIDSRGRLLAAGVPGGLARTDGVLSADVDLTEFGTIYRRVGDVAGGTAFAGAVVLVLLPVIRRRGPGVQGQEQS